MTYNVVACTSLVSLPVVLYAALCFVRGSLHLLSTKFPSFLLCSFVSLGSLCSIFSPVLLISSDRSSYSEVVLLDVQLSRIFTQSIYAIDVTIEVHLVSYMYLCK